MDPECSSGEKWDVVLPARGWVEEPWHNIAWRLRRCRMTRLRRLHAWYRSRTGDHVMCAASTAQLLHRHTFCVLFMMRN